MDSVVGKQIIGVLILFLLVILTHGCIIIPIPTPAHGGYGVITEESIASLESEKATRSDVLFKIGDPAERLHQDRFLCIDGNEHTAILSGVLVERVGVLAM